MKISRLVFTLTLFVLVALPASQVWAEVPPSRMADATWHFATVLHSSVRPAAGGCDNATVLASGGNLIDTDINSYETLTTSGCNYIWTKVLFAGGAHYTDPGIEVKTGGNSNPFQIYGCLDATCTTFTSSPVIGSSNFCGSPCVSSGVADGSPEIYGVFFDQYNVGGSPSDDLYYARVCEAGEDCSSTPTPPPPSSTATFTPTTAPTNTPTPVPPTATQTPTAAPTVGTVVFTIPLCDGVPCTFFPGYTQIPPLTQIPYPTPLATWTPPPTNTPLPTYPAVSGAVSASGGEEENSWYMDDIGGIKLIYWDFGCPIDFSDSHFGTWQLCITYTEIYAISFLGADVPLYIFEGVIVAVVISFIARK